MQKEVYSNIDLLITMSSSDSDIDELNTELLSLKRQIKNKKSEIEDLESIMNEARYFNASNELVDKNIEISLKNKINNLNRKIKNANKELDSAKLNETKIYEEITSLKNKLSENEIYVNTLEEKSNNSNHEPYYQELLESEKQNVTLLHNELNIKETKHSELLDNISNQNANIEILKNNLKEENGHLNRILENLNNPNSYIDEDLKTEDEEKVASLKKDLERLEKRRVEILTDPVIIGADAKELIASSEIYEGLNKVKELVNIIKKIPYMDINSRSILDEELEKKEAARIELSSLIDNKSYDGLNNNTIDSRLTFLNNATKANNENIASLENNIASLDEYIKTNIGPTIHSIELEVENTTKTINEYENLLSDTSKTFKEKTNLENAVEKKNKEKSLLNSVLSSYKENLLTKIEESNMINKIITKLKEENEKFALEIKNLSLMSSNNIKTKDLIEEAQDKKALKQINEEIKAIKNRQKYEKSADEIYDQIEMIISPLSTPSKKTLESNMSNPIEDLYEEDPENPRLKVVEMIPVETTTGGA